MALYVMSDIHGEYDMFLEMLEKIKFDDSKDLLYILGDIFDRGPKPLEVLEYIVTHKNIGLILGNHEQMFMNAYEEDFRRDLDIWFMNGGEVTFNALMAKGDAYIRECYNYLKKQKLYHEVLVCTLNGPKQKYLLCHAGVAVPGGHPDINKVIEFQSDDDWLWNRDHLIVNDIHFDGFICVCGHTPVQTIVEAYDEPMVFHKNDMVYIDCGACFRDGKLACVELKEDDIISHYVERK